LFFQRRSLPTMPNAFVRRAVGDGSGVGQLETCFGANYRGLDGDRLVEIHHAQAWQGEDKVSNSLDGLAIRV
jgi:hypothetical protein